MKNPRTTLQQRKPIMITFFIVAFLYLIMCPFAHSFTPSSNATALIPQKQLLKNVLPQKDCIDSSPSPAIVNQVSLLVSNQTIIPISSSLLHKPFISLTLMTTSRLLL
jgi:hypothetical protein